MAQLTPFHGFTGRAQTWGSHLVQAASAGWALLLPLQPTSTRLHPVFILCLIYSMSFLLSCIFFKIYSTFGFLNNEWLKCAPSWIRSGCRTYCIVSPSVQIMAPDLESHWSKSTFANLAVGEKRFLAEVHDSKASDLINKLMSVVSHALTKTGVIASWWVAVVVRDLPGRRERFSAEETAEEFYRCILLLLKITIAMLTAMKYWHLLKTIYFWVNKFAFHCVKIAKIQQCP